MRLIFRRRSLGFTCARSNNNNGSITHRLGIDSRNNDRYNGKPKENDEKLWHKHTKDKRGTHRGEARSEERRAREKGEGEKTKANAQIDCCFCGGVAQLSEREIERESSRGIWNPYTACRTHATGYTHTHRCRGKTLGKVNLLIWSKKVTRKTVAVCSVPQHVASQSEGGELALWQLNCSRLRRDR